MIVQFTKALLVLGIPFLLGVSFQQAALRADYQLAWSPQRPSALPLWRSQLASAIAGSFPSDSYPAFPILVGYIAVFSAVALVLSFLVVARLRAVIPTERVFYLSISTQAVFLGAALYLGRLATLRHIFGSS